ncbi:hypothetical protein BJV82DRAFT_395432 [Fennellomyces sp. T-0311]|nr:hypothetical protein BJV82DRAFT_395432 [Fennellomyces sp. T-0311]
MMKDNIEHVEIEPDQRYLDFIGPAKPDGIGRALKGHVKLTVSRPVKIRSMVIKFKGYGRICLKNSGGTVLDVDTNLLPKIKAPLLVNNKKTFQLPAGEHLVPWELQVPNVYPRSLMIKRASIHYKIELAISLGLHKKAITAEYPIVILRHLLPYKELSPLVGSRVYRHTVPGKFHYEVDCPRIVCLEQGSMPVAVKYLCIANQKPVLSIRTQLLQVEFYRCETIPKSDANLEIMDKDVQSNVFGQRFADAMKTNPKCVKFTRRKGSAFLHSVDGNPVSAWKRQVVLRHELDELLTYGIESPIVTVYHQLEIVFQFGQKYDAIRAKVPVIITSLPYAKTTSTPPASPMVSMLPAEDDTIPKYRMETLPHFIPPRVTVDAQSNNPSDKSHRRTSTATSSDETSSLSSMAQDIARERSIFMDVRQRALSGSKPSIPPPSRAGPGLQLSVAASSINLSNNGNQVPSPSLSAFGDAKYGSIRRSASASNLSAHSQSKSPSPPPQRPTRSPMRVRPALAVNTALANKVTYPGPLSDDILTHASSSRPGSVASSEALPIVDRNLLRSKALWLHRFDQPSQYYSNNTTAGTTLSRAAPSSGVIGPSAASKRVLRRPYQPASSVTRVVDPWLQILNQEYENDSDDDFGDDEMSVCTMDATSLSSATTGSGADDQSLRSRPPSPVYSPAPGLPGAIALRPQQASPIALVEETFVCSPHSVSANSVPYTVASSTVLSPRTSYALYRQRLAHAPPLPPPAIPLPEEPVSSPRNEGYPDAVQDHYLRAELPPLPPSDDDQDEELNENDLLCAKTGSRYFDDSDEEPAAQVCTCPQHGAILVPIKKKEEPVEPPQLPRLSLGSTFAASLNL